ncbi:MAG: hypothetical protein R6X19_03875 [Kiritimatiellia bacterium]
MKKTGILLFAALFCLGLAGLLSRPLLFRREAFRPPQQTDLREAPPLVAFTTVALGGFRGILADFLWLRVSTLQEEGKYVEIVQLSDWITKLEPTFAEVWSYHAWNMAYNIGVLFDNPADRWRWVDKGLRMLREEGIRYNPGAPRLYWELGWMYFNKVGGFMDDAAGYYQLRLCLAMEAILPGGRLRDPTPQQPGRLWEAFRLEVDSMARLQKEIGVLDWRLAESQALYWAWKGRAVAGLSPGLITERLFYQVMIASSMRGGLVFSSQREVMVRLARPDLFDTTLAVLDDSIRRFPDDEGIQAARQFFLRFVVFQYHIRGEAGQAARFLDLLRKREIDASPDPAVYVKTLLNSGGLAVPGYLDQAEGLFFEAEAARVAGRASEAARLDEGATEWVEGLARLLASEGRLPAMTADAIRERGRKQARDYGVFSTDVKP